MAETNRRLAIGAGAAVGSALLVRMVGWRVKRLWRAMRLFDETQIVANFVGMDNYFPTSSVQKSADPSPFTYADPIELPEQFQFKDEMLNSAEWLEYTGTNGLLILKNDQVVYEQYFQGHTESTRHISWSVAKSFVSALFGIAIERGFIDSLEQTVTDYLPEMAGTGYDGVRIKDVLQMSSGVRFNEDYDDFNSDINRFGRLMALGGSFAKFAASLENERPPGTFLQYVSIDTQVIGMILMKATDMTLSELLEQWLWQPLGMEHDAYWLVDSTNMEMALGGLNATLRDYARFGRLYLNNGNWHGEQLVPADWIKASITPDAPHLMPGENELSDTPAGYGYQWWIPEHSTGEFMAVGIYNQYIFVAPQHDLVIVKLSANSHYTENDYLTSEQSLVFFRALAAHVK